MSFVCAEEFVELRRLDRRSREHRMCLSAMMNLVLEQMREQSRCVLGFDAGAALHRNQHFELLVGKLAQASIGKAGGSLLPRSLDLPLQRLA